MFIYHSIKLKLGPKILYTTDIDKNTFPVILSALLDKISSRISKENVLTLTTERDLIDRLQLRISTPGKLQFIQIT